MQVQRCASGPSPWHASRLALSTKVAFLPVSLCRSASHRAATRRVIPLRGGTPPPRNSAGHVALRRRRSSDCVQELIASARTTRRSRNGGDAERLRLSNRDCKFTSADKINYATGRIDRNVAGQVSICMGHQSSIFWATLFRFISEFKETLISIPEYLAFLNETEIFRINRYISFFQ